MGGVKAGYRQKLFRGVHAEALKRKLDHDGLHDLCVSEFGVHSMGEMSDAQLLSLYRRWTGKTLKRAAALPRKGDADSAVLAGMVSGAEIEALAAEYARRGMGQDAQLAFTRRQLRGRRQVRSRGDYAKVMNGLRAMSRREGVR